MERRLGQISQVVTAGSDSHIQLVWETVYDIPLLGSLKQQLADEHILDEVRSTLVGTCFTVDARLLRFYGDIQD